MAIDSVGAGIETWSVSVNRLNKIWQTTFPSLIATFWLVTSSKEKVFIDKNIKELLLKPAEDQIRGVFGRSLKDLINLHPSTYEGAAYPVKYKELRSSSTNGESAVQEKRSAAHVINDIDRFLGVLNKYRRIVNSLYKGIDRSLTSARKKADLAGNDENSKEKKYYDELSDLKHCVDSLCNSLDKISVRLICMTGLVLTDEQDEQLSSEVKNVEECVKEILKNYDAFKDLMGSGRVLYDKDQKEQDLSEMESFLKEGKKKGFQSIKKELEGIRRIVKDPGFQLDISTALKGENDTMLALNASYEMLIDERLCYDLIYTDKGVIFPWPPKPESSLMIFDLYVTRDAGSSIAISIPGFNLPATSTAMPPLSKSVNDGHLFEQFDNDCSQIEEVDSEYSSKYEWTIIGTTFSRLQMALPRVIAQIWGDQDLYNKFAAVSKSDYVKEKKKISLIEQKVLDYLRDNKGSSRSREWLNANGAKVKKYKNKYYAKVYGVKELLDDLEIDFANWLGLLKEGVPLEIEDERLADKVDRKLIAAATPGRNGRSLIDDFVKKYGDDWEKIVSSISRSRFKIRKIDFHFDIWDVPEVIVLVDCIHNDLSYVTRVIEHFKNNVLDKPSRKNRVLDDDDGLGGEGFLDEIDEEILELLKSFFDKAVDKTTANLRKLSRELAEFVDLQEEDVLDLQYEKRNDKYVKEFSKFVIDQAEITLPKNFNISIDQAKIKSQKNESSEVLLSPKGLSMPFPLRPSLGEIYQAWASSDAGIPTFTRTASSM